MADRTSLFLKEPGRAKETHLELTASPADLKKLKVGDLLKFKTSGDQIQITDEAGKTLGEIEPGDLKQKIHWALEHAKDIFAVVLGREKKRVALLIKTEAPLFKDEPEEIGEDLQALEEGAEGEAIEGEGGPAAEEKEESEAVPGA
jgi:hypothetical protein